MKRSKGRRQIARLGVAILALALIVALWVGATKTWIAHDLRALAASNLYPSFDFDDLTYSFPRTVELRGVRLTSPDPEAPGDSIEILVVDSLTLELSEIPQPESPIRMHRILVAGLTLNLVRIREGDAAGHLLGFSDLVKPETVPIEHSAQPSARFSELFEVRTFSVRDASVKFDPRDGSGATMLIDGITAELLLEPTDAGSYGIEFSLDHHPVFSLGLRGKLKADDQRLEIVALSGKLRLGREQDHYLTPAMGKFLAKRDITGRLTLAGTGLLDFTDADSSQLQASIEIHDAGYAAGDYGLALDHVGIQLSVAGKSVSLQQFTIDALGGHASIDGSFELDDSLTGALTFEGTDMQIGDLLRAAKDAAGVPAYSGILGFSGNLRGPLADLDQRAKGGGQLSLRKARLARLPVLSTIDEALDRVAEAAMKREHQGHDALSLEFSFDGGRARIEKLRMNSRWYGLRGHGDVFLDSHLDLEVDGGVVARVDNEMGDLGEVLGEITQTLLRAHVTGTLSEPEVGIEILRQPISR